MTATREERLAQTFVQLADTLVADFDLMEFLHLLVERCVELLGVAAAGLLLADQRGGLRVMASSSERVRLLELFQLQSEEGPCLDSYRSGEQVVSADLEREPGRWPAFEPEARAASFRSVNAIPMRLRGDVVGALNLFRSEPGGLSAGDLLIGQAMADVATVSILQERSIQKAHVLTRQLQTALDSRIVVEQAKGVLAESARLDMAQAFHALRSYARDHNRRLGEVARAVVDRTLTADELAIGREVTPFIWPLPRSTGALEG